MPIFYDGKRGFPAKVNVCAVYSSYCQFYVTIMSSLANISPTHMNSKFARYKLGKLMVLTLDSNSEHVAHVLS